MPIAEAFLNGDLKEDQLYPCRDAVVRKHKDRNVAKLVAQVWAPVKGPPSFKFVTQAELLYCLGKALWAPVKGPQGFKVVTQVGLLYCLGKAFYNVQWPGTQWPRDEEACIEGLGGSEGIARLLARAREGREGPDRPLARARADPATREVDHQLLELCRGALLRTQARLHVA